MIRSAIVVACCMLAMACERPEQAAGAHGAPNAELRRLFEDDQAARSGPIESLDHDALQRANSASRLRVGQLERAGALRTAADFRHAAMIMQHGVDSLDYLQAHVWASRSEMLDSSNIDVLWLVAASWDRYQMSRGRPQWYGTQTDRVPRGTGPVVLYDIDTSRVSDAERQRRGVGTLRELRARIEAMNRQLGVKPGDPD